MKTPAQLDREIAESFARPLGSSTSMTKSMEAALKIARRDGSVSAGRNTYKGCVERVSASAIQALIRRGLLVQTLNTDGGLAGRLPEAK